MVSSATDTPPLTNADRLAEAHAASEAKEWQRAADLWDALRADLPQDARCWHKAGEAYCHAGMFDQADHILDQAVALFPDDEWAAYLSIVVARRKADWPEALRRAEKMGRSFPDSWRPMVEAAGALAALQRQAESEEIRREAVKRFPDEFWTNFHLARLEAEHSDAPGAVRIWTKLAERFSSEPAAAEALEAAREAARHPLRQRSPISLGAQSVTGDGARRPEAPTGQSRGFPWRRRRTGR